MDLLIYLFRSSCCFSIFYGLYLIAFRRSTFFILNRIYLLSIPFLSCVLCAWHPVVHDQGLQAVIYPYLLRGVSTIASPDFNSSIFPFWSAILLVYGVVSSVIGIRSILVFFRLMRLYRKAKLDPSLDVKVLELPGVGGAGSFYNMIFKGPNIEKQKNEVILTHEKIHIQQRHWMDLVFCDLVIALTWFNPLVYFYKKSLLLQHEYTADKLTCEELVSIERYQQMLLSELFDSPYPLNTHSFNNPSFLKQRMMKLNQKKSAYFHMAMYLMVIPFAVLVMSFNSKLDSNASATGYLPSGNLHQNPSGGKIHKTADVEPVYPGGVNGLMKDLASYLNTHYPPEAKEKDIQGKVVVNFVVEKDGQITDAKAIRGKELGGGLAKAGIDAVNSLRHFEHPGLVQKKAVRVSYTVPITFRLESDKKTTNK